MRQLCCRNNKPVVVDNNINSSQSFFSRHPKENLSPPFPPLSNIPPLVVYWKEVHTPEPEPSAGCRNPNPKSYPNSQPSTHTNPNTRPPNPYLTRKNLLKLTTHILYIIMYFSLVANSNLINYSRQTGSPSIPVVMPPQLGLTGLGQGIRPPSLPHLHSEAPSCHDGVYKNKNMTEDMNTNATHQSLINMYIMCTFTYFPHSYSSHNSPKNSNRPINTKYPAIVSLNSNTFLSPPLFTSITLKYVRAGIYTITQCNLGQVKLVLRSIARQCSMPMTSKVGHCLSSTSVELQGCPPLNSHHDSG